MRKLTFAAPFLVAIFTVVSLYQANAERLSPGSMIMPAVLGLGIAGLFLVLFWLLKWTSAAAPFVASIFTGVFLLWYIIPWYGDVVILVAALFVGIFAKRSTMAGSIILAGIMLVGTGYAGIQAARIHAAEPAEPVSSGPFLYKPGQPNIYFIIPDRMTSPAAMREIGIDPDPVLNDLRGLGFYVKEDQMSADQYLAGMGGSFFVETTEVKIKTTRTMRYFASVLNGGLVIPLDISYDDCRKLIQDNAVFTWLHGQGYSITNLPSWFTETQRFTDQDVSLPFTDVTLLEKFFQDELSEAYFSRTILNGLNFRVFESIGSQQRIEKARLQWQAQHLVEVAAGGPSSTFVMAHLLLPHEPYAFANPDDPVPVQYSVNLRSALLYLDELAGEIRAKDPTATIIIQSDEGIAFHKPAELNNNLTKVQWSGVFTAWYIPGQSMDRTIYLDQIKHTDILGVVLESK